MKFRNDILYQIIYADPPWEYDNPKGNDPAMGGLTYPVMSNAELQKLPIKRITDKNCSLFLWATMPKLKEAIWLGEEWGFKYVSCAFTWIKSNPSGNGIYSGLGHWTNGNAELCLFFKKGQPKRIAKDVKQVQIFPVRKHSEKPPPIRNEIIRLVGDLPRIELFAREKVEGWDCWGNETGNGIGLIMPIEKFLPKAKLKKQSELFK
jgi:N6-adenosine-specific RNA methylase IME4